MTISEYLSTCLFVVVMSATPGPNNLMMLASGLNFGIRRSVPAMAGVAFGFGGVLLLAGFGAEQLFQRFPSVHATLKWASIVYLLWLAWRIGSADVSATPSASIGGERPLSFVEMALLQLINPKGWAAALGGVSAYTQPDRFGVTFAALIGLFMGLSPLVSFMWAAFGAALTRLLANPRQRYMFNLAMAFALVASLYPVAFT